MWEGRTNPGRANAVLPSEAGVKGCCTKYSQPSTDGVFGTSTHHSGYYDRKPRAWAYASSESYWGFGTKLWAGIRKQTLVRQNLARHQAVLGFLRTQMSRKEGETRSRVIGICKRSNCIMPEFVRDHPQSVGLPFVVINIRIWFLIR